VSVGRTSRDVYQRAVGGQAEASAKAAEIIELGGRDNAIINWINNRGRGAEPKACRVARLEVRPVEIALEAKQERWGELPIIAGMNAADPAGGF